jgi:hypothetical protein
MVNKVAAREFKIQLSPTQERFAFSPAIINVIYGSMGEGKTHAGVVSMIVHAQRNKQPIHCAIVRDTHENIKISTLPSIKKSLDSISPGLYRSWNDSKSLEIRCEPKVTVDLFGIDDEASLSKLGQGPEYALIWLEEPAPIIDKKNAGLSVDVYRAALSRCARQGLTIIPRVQVTMNPPDEDHWTFTELLDAPAVDPDLPLITKAVFRINTGENKFISEFARQTVKMAYKNDIGLWTRYVEGNAAPVYRGAKVTPGYNPEIHLVPYPIEPAKGLIGFRFWDGWYSPSALLGQITHSGRLIFLDTLHKENSDVSQLIDFDLAPLLRSPRWFNVCKGWRDIGDISMATGDQSNKAESAAKVIERKLNTYFESGPARWEQMTIGLGKAFNKNVNGRPAIQINPQERFLHRALSGDWHYKTDNSGRIAAKIPEKNLSSHLGDAFANGVNVLIPELDSNIDKDFLRKIREQARIRAASYGNEG